METWIVDHDASYDATPWPFQEPWEQFIRSPAPLPDTVDDFGRASPSDGPVEMATTPANLPRSVPLGRYRMAVYHDAEYLYAFLDSQNGPEVVSLEKLHAIPRLAGVYPINPSVAMISADEQFVFRFGVGRSGQKDLKISHQAYGGRRKPAPGPEAFVWDVVVIPRPGGELTCWRIARSCLGGVIEGNRLRLSVSRICLTTLEAVAWGSHSTWDTRPDEAGVVRLVNHRQDPPSPRVRRVELCYDPATERGKFRIHWTAPFGEEMTENKIDGPVGFYVPWKKYSFRLNFQEHAYDQAALVETDEFPIADGDNRIEISAPCSPARRFFLEKRSGNRVIAPPGPAVVPRDNAWVTEMLREECELAVIASRERVAEGPARKFRTFESLYGASIGRVYRYLIPDPRLLDIVREEADFTISLQRDDGTFAGLHMERYGVKPYPWAGGAFDSGQAGELWVVAYQLLGDQKYLDASRRLVEAYKDYRVELNHNYAAFALYHLGAHYRVTGDPLALEHALYYAKNCVIVDLLPMGFHRAHNYYSGYGSITLRGLTSLCAALPLNHPYRATVLQACIRMANHFVMRMQPDGMFDARGRSQSGERMWPWGLFGLGLLLGPQDAAELDKVIQRQLHIPDANWALTQWKTAAAGQEPKNYAGHYGVWLAVADFPSYWANRDAILRGQGVDLATLV